MPTQIGRLRSLQRLTDFKVGNQTGSASISELRELCDLHGKLAISNLQNVLNASDALEAYMNRKTHLEKLYLAWDAKHTGDSQKEMEVLESLQPPINLKDLTINHYRGARFPDWLGDRSFIDLKSLCLRGCSDCCEMPPLGQLPFLQNLTIEGMHSIVKVGYEFYEHGSSGINPFQSLEELTFRKMPNLKEIKFPRHLPYLKKLKIDECKRLLNMVSIGGVGLSTPNLTEIHISFCEKLKALPERMRTLLPSLQTLHLCHLPEIQYSFSLGGLPSSLSELVIDHCDKLMACRMDWGLQSLPSLSICKVGGECEKEKFLESFPEENLLPTSLTELWIVGLPNMKSLNPNALRPLTSLESLWIKHCPNLQSFPDEGLPSSLSRLNIQGSPLLKISHIAHDQWLSHEFILGEVKTVYLIKVRN